MGIAKTATLCITYLDTINPNCTRVRRAWCGGPSSQRTAHAPWTRLPRWRGSAGLFFRSFLGIVSWPPQQRLGQESGDLAAAVAAVNPCWLPGSSSLVPGGAGHPGPPCALPGPGAQALRPDFSPGRTSKRVGVSVLKRPKEPPLQKCSSSPSRGEAPGDGCLLYAISPRSRGPDCGRAAPRKPGPGQPDLSRRAVPWARAGAPASLSVGVPFRRMRSHPLPCLLPGGVRSVCSGH